MTDLFLMGIFVLCIVIGYIVVKRSGGILEHMLFRNSNSWYNLRESNEPCRDAGAGNACSQAISRDSGSIGRMPASPEKRSFFGLGTAQKPEQTETGADAGNACSQAISRDSGSIGRTPASPEKQSFFGLGTAQKPEQTQTPVSPEKQRIRKGLGAMRQSISECAEKKWVSGEGDRRRKDYKSKDYKAGIRHEWKTN